MCLALLSTGSGSYERAPDPRNGHQTISVGSKVYMWSGWLDGLPRVHVPVKSNPSKKFIEVFDTKSGDWTRQSTSGTPPAGVTVSGYGCAAVGDALHYFGGYCNYGDCFYNSLHTLNTSSLQWTVLSPVTQDDRAPMRKGYCGMVAFKDGEEDLLYVVGGVGPTPSHHQPGAQCDPVASSDSVRCNEHHIFSLDTSEYK